MTGDIAPREDSAALRETQPDGITIVSIFTAGRISIRG